MVLQIDDKIIKADKNHVRPGKINLQFIVTAHTEF